MLRVHCAVLNARTSTLVCTCSQSYGGHGERETPGNIPNPEAKPLSADGTALETGWESRTPPDNHSRKGPSIRAGALSSFHPPENPRHPPAFGTESRPPPPGFRYRKLQGSAAADFLAGRADVVGQPGVE